MVITIIISGKGQVLCSVSQLSTVKMSVLSGLRDGRS